MPWHGEDLQKGFTYSTEQTASSDAEIQYGGKPFNGYDNVLD